MSRKLPQWCKEAKKNLIDRDMTVTELSNEIGVSRAYVSCVVNGSRYAPELADRITKALGIRAAYTDNII